MTAASRRTRRPAVHDGVELRCGTQFEDEARAGGHAVVAGVDEVGRGALCGPVVAAAVVLGEGFDCDGLDDSKRLTARQRERLAARVREKARAVAIGSCEPSEIDALNILRATLEAMRRALRALPVRPDLVLVDALSVSIAAASIVAKVTRDALMLELDARHPGYGLAENMGYGSREHRDALHRIGPSPIHRRSFHGIQAWLFS
jgi:ribonuclease HII